MSDLKEGRVLVTGSRYLRDEVIVWRGLMQAIGTIGSFVVDRPIVVVHGDARGADQLAKFWAEKMGLKQEAHPADWARLGDYAGPVRNTEMVRLGASVCVAFWDMRNCGTYDCYTKALKAGIPTIVIPLTFGLIGSGRTGDLFEPG